MEDTMEKRRSEAVDGGRKTKKRKDENERVDIKME